MQPSDLLPHLFRLEFAKITAVLCKVFGIAHLQMAEDIASDTFLAAAETWPFNGIPDNPTAWLYAVAKNKARNQVNRQHTFTGKIIPEYKNFLPEPAALLIDLSEQNIQDSQLQMLFAVCQPVISVEAQISLALRILCGFGIDEIASALLTNKETINKRLVRAKQKLKQYNIKLEYPAEKRVPERLQVVLTTLYLLFNEGYYSENKDAIIRKDFCAEAMRLTYLLLQNEQTNQPSVHALLALMCFHSCRLDARTTPTGQIILYPDQDETLWNQALITQGSYYLHQSAKGNTLTKYHLEASIAYWHTQKNDSREKWETILQLYNVLLQIEYSPLAALNRTFALYRANGKEEAILEAEKLQLTDNPYYFTLLGELYTGTDNTKAARHFEQALSLLKTQPEKQVILAKIDSIRLKI